ncbi:MAG: DUF1553 domain-containing protein, partial [Flavitalea sp.]
FQGDVSTSLPAKTPFLKISSPEINTMMSFINKKDTGQLMVSVMGDNDTIRKTYVLDRGVYDKPKGEVIRPAAIPAILDFDTAKYPRNRLGLAEWTVNKDNPLTARVFVNQVWQSIFGRGLVKTTGDFGMQGELPTHPALLDWLAVDFMQHGWDIKRLMKMIVSSATYRQSSKITEAKLQADPENIYLSRSPRFRYAAEIVRDHVLSSSGLLVKEIGGPSVKPYQPKGLWESASSGRGVLATYRQDHGRSLYRRGMYTFIKLTVPPPSMIIFDASNRDQCEVKRSKTSTPLQALVMLNDPAVLEASRVLAQKLLSEKLGPEESLRKAFRLIICRKPKEEELKILSAYRQNQLSQFRNKSLNAAVTLKVGEYPADASLDADETAAMMKTISAIYNLEEAITKS